MTRTLQLSRSFFWVGVLLGCFPILAEQDDLVFGSDLGFHSQMFTLLRKIASTARSYSGKIFTYMKQICKAKSLCLAEFDTCSGVVI